MDSFYSFTAKDLAEYQTGEAGRIATAYPIKKASKPKLIDTSKGKVKEIRTTPMSATATTFTKIPKGAVKAVGSKVKGK